MQFITTDQRIAIENFEVGIIYTVTFTNADNFTGACIGIGPDFVAFQRTAPELIFCLTMAAAADVASIDPLGSDIGKILTYTGSVPVSIKTDGSPLLAYTIKGNELPGTGDKTANLFDEVYPNLGTTIRYKAIEVGNGDYTLSSNIPDTNRTAQLFLLAGNVSSGASTANNGVYNGLTRTVTAIDGYVTIAYVHYNGHASLTDYSVMLNTGSTAKPYDPYGYKIPILSADTTTNIYLDNPLRKSIDGTAVDELSSNGKLTQRVDTDGSVLSTPIISYIDMPTIPTTDGLSIFDIDTTIKPSEVYLKYFSPIF